MRQSTQSPLFSPLWEKASQCRPRKLAHHRRVRSRHICTARHHLWSTRQVSNACKVTAHLLVATRITTYIGDRDRSIRRRRIGHDWVRLCMADKTLCACEVEDSIRQDGIRIAPSTIRFGAPAALQSSSTRHVTATAAHTRRRRHLQRRARACGGRIMSTRS